jgi:predicted aconitase with swiveling domain
MELTPEQSAILNGARGAYLGTCMRWLVEWGDVMGARRLVKCDNTDALLPVPNLDVDGLAALGCIVNGIPMITDLERDPFECIRSGDHVVVDADLGVVRVTRP